jgi:hypothetical protein
LFFQEVPSYAFQYSIQDSNSYSDFEAKEERAGENTAGSYRINLPDGRVQIVTYTADENGYNADVKFEGEAKYPEDVKPAYAAPSKL